MDCLAWKNSVAKSFTIGLISYHIAAFTPVCTYADGKVIGEEKGCRNAYMSVSVGMIYIWIYIFGLNI